MKHKIKKLYRLKFPIYSVMLFVVLVGFMMATKPSESKFAFSVIPLGLTWGFVYCLIRSFALSGRERLFRTLALSVSSTVTLFIMFSALGDLAPFDIGLLFCLSFLITFYVRRTWPN